MSQDVATNVGRSISNNWSYPAYKDAGIEWLGQIPSHWNVTRMRFLCDIKTGGRDTQDAEEDGEYPFFVRSDTVERISTYSYEGEAVLTSGDGAGVGKIFHHSIGRLEYHQRVYLFSNFRDILGKLFYYYIKANLYKVVLAMSAKSTVDSIRLPMLQNFQIAIGPLEEQAEIIKFLERRTAGIEWLGKIPTHWETIRIKFVSSFSNGFSYSSSEWREDGYPVLRMSNISPNGELNFTETNTKYIDRQSAERTRSFKLNRNDVLIAMTDMSPRMGVLGKTIIFDFDDKSCFLNQRVGRIKLSSDKVDLRYFHFVTNSDVCRDQIKSTVFPNVQYNASTEAIRSTVIPLPPMIEQHKITGLLKRKTSDIDRLVLNIREGIDRLQEYRATLISAAVTGKIDVREEA